MKPFYQFKKHVLILDGAYSVFPIHYLSVEEKLKAYAMLFESPGLQTNAHFLNPSMKTAVCAMKVWVYKLVYEMKFGLILFKKQSQRSGPMLPT